MENVFDAQKLLEDDFMYVCGLLEQLMGELQSSQSENQELQGQIRNLEAENNRLKQFYQLIGYPSVSS